MSFTSVSDILNYLGSRQRPSRSSRRRFYAADVTPARYQEMPFLINKTRRLGVAETPAAARITPEDMKIARMEQPLEPPESDADVPRYIDELKQTNLYPNVVNKLKAFTPHSPGGDKWHWSIAQFVGHDVASRITKEDYQPIYEKLEPLLPGSRRRIHNNALDKSLNPLAVAKPGQDKHFTMIIGPPGAGKSTIGVPHALTITPHYTTINVDEMRKHLPEYEGWNSGVGHMEAAYLTYGPLMQRAFAKNHHMIYDATGSNAKTMEDTLKAAHEYGYKNHLILVHRPPHESMANAWNRFLHNPYGAKHPDEEPSRFVDPIWAYQHVGNKPEATYHHLKTSPLLTSHARLDPRTPRGQRPIILESSHAR